MDTRRGRRKSGKRASRPPEGQRDGSAARRPDRGAGERSALPGRPEDRHLHGGGAGGAAGHDAQLPEARRDDERREEAAADDLHRSGQAERPQGGTPDRGGDRGLPPGPEERRVHGLEVYDEGPRGECGPGAADVVSDRHREGRGEGEGTGTASSSGTHPDPGPDGSGWVNGNGQGDQKLGTRNLRKVYRGRAVVHDVSIEVGPGEIVGLLGPNGAGKTTTFYMVVGLTPPDEGGVFLGDEDITDLPMYLRAQRGISY